MSRLDAVVSVLKATGMGYDTAQQGKRSSASSDSYSEENSDEDYEEDEGYEDEDEDDEVR